MSPPFARSAIEIKTPRVLMRTAVESDKEAFHQNLINPANTPFQDTEVNLTLDQVSQRIAFFAKAAGERKHGWIVFISRETGDFLGYGGYNALEEVDAEEFLGSKATSSGRKYLADWGIMLDHKYWGKGYGREISIGLVEFARIMGCELFRTETSTDNEPWRALMRGIGVGSCENLQKASYDQNKEVLCWRWDLDTWEKCKQKLQNNGKWTELQQ